MILETERLILRYPELSDVPTIHALAAHPDIALTTLNIPHPYPEDAARAFVQSLIDTRDTSPYITLGMVRKADGQLMGMITLRPEERFSRAEMGYWIGLPFWGQGYTSEAARRLINYGFAGLGLNRVFASYLVHNPASRVSWKRRA